MTPLKRHVQTCYVFQNAGKLLGPDRARLCTCNEDFGTQAKSERARDARTERLTERTFSSNRPKNTGYRYLTPAEINKWNTRIQQIVEARS
jgi:hypothetical protein